MTGGAEPPKQSALSPEHLAALKEYQKALSGSDVGGYANLQSMLRTGKPTYAHVWDEEQGREHLKHLNDALRARPLETPTTVHRGLLARKDHPLLTAAPGMVYSDPGVTSASRDPKVAAKFATKLNTGETPMRIEMQLPKGTHALHLKEHGLSDHEKETTIAPNTKFKVLSRRVVGGVHHVKVQALPDEPPAQQEGVASHKQVRGDPLEGPHTEVTMHDGASPQLANRHNKKG